MVHLPEGKRYFRIGEVSRILGVEPYVLRYWESEFPQISPRRAESNHRTYQRKDLEIIVEVKRLLYDEKMTIEGARKRLKEGGSDRKPDYSSTLQYIKDELRNILNILP